MINPDLPEMLTALKSSGLHITIETSGIEFVANLPCDLMSISPKLSNSAPDRTESACDHEKIRLNLPALRNLIDNYNYQLKFVIDKPADIEEITDCIESLKNVNPRTVLLMPQAANQKQYLEKSKIAAELCKKTNFRFSPRLQVMLWNNQKGT